MFKRLWMSFDIRWFCQTRIRWQIRISFVSSAVFCINICFCVWLNGCHIHLQCLISNFVQVYVSFIAYDRQGIQVVAVRRTAIQTMFYDFNSCCYFVGISYLSLPFHVLMHTVLFYQCRKHGMPYGSAIMHNKYFRENERYSWALSC